MPRAKVALGVTPSGVTLVPNAMSYKPQDLYRVRTLSKPRTLYRLGQLTRLIYAAIKPSALAVGI